MVGEHSHRQPTFGCFFNFTLFYIKPSELLLGTSGKEGKGEDSAGKNRMHGTVNRKKEKSQKEAWTIFGLKRE